MNAFTFLSLVGATWRLSSLIAVERGPYNLFGRLRNLIGIVDGEVPYGKNELARGTLCMWCNSVWIGTALAIFGAFTDLIQPPLTIPAALAFSCGAILIEEVLKWLERASTPYSA